jgi:hypothetical protein
MPHEVLKGRQGDAGPDHIRSKGVAEPVWIGGRDLAMQSMVPEQRAESGRRHRLTTPTAFEGNEQIRGVGQRPFQAQVTLKHLHNLDWQWQGALFPALAQIMLLPRGHFQILELERQDLTGTQSIK